MIANDVMGSQTCSSGLLMVLVMSQQLFEIKFNQRKVNFKKNRK